MGVETVFIHGNVHGMVKSGPIQEKKKSYVFCLYLPYVQPFGFAWAALSEEELPWTAYT